MTTSSTSSSTKPVSEAASSAENGRRAASPDLVITGTSTSSTKLAPLFTPSGGGSAAAATTPSSSSRKRKPYGDASSSFRRGGGGASRSSPPPVSSSSTATDPSSSSKRPKVSATLAARPLADALRPTSLLELLGQDAVLGEGSVLRALIEQGKLGSAILWGDPGTGKTTLARIVARVQEADVRELSAVSAKLDDVRKILDQAANQLRLTGRRTVLFVDEIHRFTKAQLDVFLPAVESGSIQLLGATSENPSFSVNRALLSRCRVVRLSKLSDASMTRILVRAISCWLEDHENELWAPSSVEEGLAALLPAELILPAAPEIGAKEDAGEAPETSEGVPIANSSATDTNTKHPPLIDKEIMTYLASMADGDARVALNGLEMVLGFVTKRLQQGNPVVDQAKWSAELLKGLRSSIALRYDRSGDDRYDMISALHKSIRGSDGSAALYWLARMLMSGEDPLYIARRLVVVASEDVGLADNSALALATSCFSACHTIGMPECRINLAHTVAYLSEAPKSTRAYEAYKRAEAACAESSGPEYEVPMQIRNAPTQLMRELNYGADYHYNPKFAHPVENTYLPGPLALCSSKGGMDEIMFLQTEGGHARSRDWDEQALKAWEDRLNQGKKWEGRMSKGGPGGDP